MQARATASKMQALSTESLYPPLSPDFDALSGRSKYMRMFSTLRSILADNLEETLRAQQSLRPYGELFRSYALYFADWWASPLPAIVPFQAAEPPFNDRRFGDILHDLRQDCKRVMLYTNLRDGENQRELIWLLASIAALLGCPVYASLHEDHAHGLAWAMRSHPRLGAAVSATQQLSPELSQLVWSMVPNVHYQYRPSFTATPPSA